MGLEKGACPMKKQNFHLIPIILFALGIFFAGGAVRAQDPAVVAPKIFKVIFENERIRIAEADFKPGDKIGTHSHPDHAVYVLMAGTLQLTSTDGKKKDVMVKVGDVVWAPAETHQNQNIGTTEVKLLLIELKEPAQGKANRPIQKIN
jgi:quercetin dioxygenase-like cupin family protein